MGVVALFRVCLLLVMTFKGASDRVGKPITCEAGTFDRGQPAAITCNFHEINATGYGVNLVRYLPAVTEYNPRNTILMCAWQQVESTHNCLIATGYEFDQTIKDSTTVRIKNVSDEYAGLHMCFLVPPDGTDSHACQLIVKDASIVSPTTTLRNDEITPSHEVNNTETWKIGFVVVLITAVILMAALGLCRFHWRRRSTRRPHIDDHVASCPLIQVDKSKCSIQEDLPETTAYSDKRIMTHLNRFLVGPEQIKMLMQATQKELEAYSTPQATSNNTFCTTVQALPNKTEWGDVLVVNLSSKRLHIVTVKLRGDDIDTDGNMTYSIPADVRLGTSKQLLEFIADRVSMFLTSNKLFSKQQSVGCILSFPCKYDTDGDLTTARIAKWSKGFRCKDVVERDWRDLLQNALKKKIVCNLKIKAVVNDLVALFMSAVWEDDKCSMAVGLSNGFSACYLQQGEDQSTSGDELNCTGKVIISTECGALGEDGSLDDFRTEFDITLDQNSVNPGQQILEKMISRLHLGEIVRLVLLKLIQKGLLFSPVYSKFTFFNEKGGFPTEHVALIQSDTSEDHSVTKAVLYNLKVYHYDAEDCNIVKYVCRIVFQRSAFLAAAAISTLVKHVKLKEVTIAVDGSLYRIHPRFAKLLEAKTQELAGPEYKVKFLAQPGGTGIGAALTAAISMSSGTV